MTRPHIQAALSAVEAQAHSAAVADRQETLEHATRTVRATIADVVDWDEHSVRVKRPAAIAPTVLGAIKTIDQTEREVVGANGERKIRRTVKIAMHGKDRALELLFDHHGLRKPITPPTPEDELRIRIILTDDWRPGVRTRRAVPHGLAGVPRGEPWGRGMAKYLSDRSIGRRAEIGWHRAQALARNQNYRNEVGTLRMRGLAFDEHGIEAGFQLGPVFHPAFVGLNEEGLSFAKTPAGDQVVDLSA